jgi:sugar phosphate isomerase/epimerase
VPPKHPFGLSTRLFADQRLGREQLAEIASHGFETIDLFAIRTHTDYSNPAAIADLQQWLAEARLTLHAVHAPVADSIAAGRLVSPLSLASADAAARTRALEEVERALHIARRIAFGVLIVHIGLPRSDSADAAMNSRDAARRSLEALHAAAEPLGVRIAIEVLPNELSRPGSLVHFVEDVVDASGVGICLDLGHAQMDGDAVDAVETVSEHLLAVEVHDNRGRSDDHLVPFEGTIDWPSTLTTIQKVGYEGPLTFELKSRGPVRDTLERAVRARQRMERLLAS